jgi:hypothetical protein
LVYFIWIDILPFSEHEPATELAAQDIRIMEVSGLHAVLGGTSIALLKVSIIWSNVHPSLCLVIWLQYFSYQGSCISITKGLHCFIAL